DLGHAGRRRARRARGRDRDARAAGRRARGRHAARRPRPAGERRGRGGMTMSALPERRPTALSAADHALLRRLLPQRPGVVLDESREQFAEMRLGGLATELGFDSLAEVVESLRTEESWGVLHRLVVEALAISETSWFRDAPLWAALRDTVLPELIARRLAVRRLEIWSAACATGQEPLSLAMLLHDLAPKLAGWDVRLLATDFSHGILKRARAGCYSPIELNRGVPRI